MRTMRIWHISLLTLLSIAAPEVWPLGLGTIQVDSGLGEPLVAQIPLTDTSLKTTADCFNLRRITEEGSQPLKATLQITSHSETAASLAIRSVQPVNDPIVELTLVYHCEDQLQRHYTVLLDPPLYDSVSQTPSSASPATPVVKAESPPIESVVKKPKKRSKRKTTPSAQSASLQAMDSTLTTPSNSELNATAADTQMHSERGSSDSKARSTSNKSAAIEANPPRLIVSGSSSGSIALSSMPLQLQLERTMSDSPPSDAAQGDLALNDLSDDMTAMSNKLKYLQTEITKLQQRNQYLEASQKAALKTGTVEAKVSPSSAEAGNPWWWYALIAGGIIAVLACVEWYRRRREEQYLDLDDEESLFDTALSHAEEDPLNLATPTSTEVKHSPPKQASSNSFVPAPQEPEVTEVNEGILEQAEVFVAHGRSHLAITLLQDHLREHPKLSPAPWLLLLSLLKRENMEEDYNIAALECKRYFNFFVPEFSDPVAPDNSSLEDYPNARELVINTWGSPQAIPVLDELIYNRRNEARQGFDRSAYIDILLLRSIAQSQGLADLNTMENGQKSVMSGPAETQVMPNTSASPNAGGTSTTGMRSEVMNTPVTQDSLQPFPNGGSLEDEEPPAPLFDRPDTEQIALEESQRNLEEAPTLEFESVDFSSPIEADLELSNESASTPSTASKDDGSIDFNLDWPDETLHTTEDEATLSLNEEKEEKTAPDSEKKRKAKKKTDDNSKPLDFDVEFKL